MGLFTGNPVYRVCGQFKVQNNCSATENSENIENLEVLFFEEVLFF